METKISVEDLFKSYGNNHVLKGISFGVEQGEIFALLGANGAGKTTTLECMEGIRKCDSGKIEIKGKTGVQLQSSSLPQNIKSMEAIRLFAKWHSSDIDNDYLARLGVVELKNKQYHQLSTGQKRRLHLALAMIGDPDIVFLDEPTAGLDVEGRISLHDEIRALQERGKTIIMASHDMAEVEELCNRIAILRDGNIAFIGTASELTQHIQGIKRVHIRLSLPVVFERLKYAKYIDDKQGYLVFQVEQLEDGIAELAALVKKGKSSIRDLKIEHPSLEQRFIDIAKGDKQ